MKLVNILIQAWPIWLVMAFLIWARVYASARNTDPPRGPVMLLLILVLFLNLNRVPLSLWLYLLCLPPMGIIVWRLWHLPVADSEKEAEIE